MKQITFNKWKCHIEFGTYSNGRTVIELNDAETGEPIAVATVNVPEHPVPEGHVLIKNYSENSGMFEQLYAQGIVGPAISKVKLSQFTDNVVLCKLLIEPK